MASNWRSLGQTQMQRGNQSSRFLKHSPKLPAKQLCPPPHIQLWNHFCAPGSSEPWLLLRYEWLLCVLLGTGDVSLSQLFLSYDQFFLLFSLIKKSKTLLLQHNPFVFTFWTPYLEKDHFFLLHFGQQKHTWKLNTHLQWTWRPYGPDVL